LLPNRTHILHFIGHGTFDEKNNEGVLIMADEDGKTELVDSERLRVLVQGRSRLALIVLNSCLGTQSGDAQPFSSVAAGLVKSGIPAVIAMQFEISDEAAREISETFYTSLSLNMPVDAALTEARRRIFLSNRNSLEWATPILYMQVPDGQLFEFKGARPTTGSVARSIKPAFETNAAKRYAEGEDAVARGDWAAAVTAYRGAMVYVPNYRDAGEKLSICASRSNAATLREKAQKSISMQHYGAALQELTEAAKLDPTLDVDQLRETAECGQKYQQALVELHRGHRTAAVDLLREIASRRPDFEDAAQRLEDLASGGDGLLGQPADPKAMVPTESERTPAETAAWKDRFKQLGTWFTATPEVQYQPVPGAEAAADEKGVLEKGRELLDGWLRPKTSVGPVPEKPRQQPVIELAPPPPKPLSPVPVTTAETQTASAPVTSQKTPPPPNPKPQARRGPVQTPAANAGDSRIYQTGLRPEFVCEAIRDYFLSQGCESQVLEDGGVWVTQGQKGGARQTDRTHLAATVVMEPSFPRLRVSMGGGAWVERGTSVARGAQPVGSLITGPIGMADQKTLINILWGLVERFVAQSGGRRIS
jgi:hypothetical protein